MKNNTNTSFRIGLAAAGLMVACGAQPALAGFKSLLSPTGVGKVEASLAYTPTATAVEPTTAFAVEPTTATAVAPNTAIAVTPENYTKPSAGVTGLGTWTAKVPQPAGSPLVCTSTVKTVYLTGGWKALARSWVTTGVTADNPELKQKLEDEQFSLTPSLCGASYDIASGDEEINGKRYLVVLGKATAGTAAWFRGYVFDSETAGIPATKENVMAHGTKLYEALVKGPFDFGDVASPDRCQAMKVPIEYDGPNLYMVADGIAESATDLEFYNPPTSVTIGCSDPQEYPVLQTTGGCGPVWITYDPPFNLLSPGTSTVTATATDSLENYTTVLFQVVRPYLEFTGFYAPINGSGGDCSAPIRTINAGNKVPIKFDAKFCGTSYRSILPPTVTISKIDPLSCAVIAVPIDHQYFQWVANQWHFNWNTLVTDRGRYRIEVELGDGGHNPYAIVELR